MADDTTAICVIGAGPRGISVVERICANATGTGTATGPVVVHIVDPFAGRGGRVWYTGQPPVLLMNTITSQISMYTDDSVDCAGPVVPGPSLYEWMCSDAIVESGCPEYLLAEARQLGPDSYPSRQLYGFYLSWVLSGLVERAPATVRIEWHRGVAVALDDADDGTQTVTLRSGAQLTGLTSVVLAQGHVDMPLTAEEQQLASFASRVGRHYQPPANPADTDLSRIQPGEPVALRGMGLNFFDYMVLLTVARGGRFERDGDRLVYRMSGQEPVIWTGSRRGIPYHARGENQKGATARHEPWFITPYVIERMRKRADSGRPAEFRRDLWPLIAAEVEGVYYYTLLRERGDERGAEEFRDQYPVRVFNGAGLAILLDRLGITGEDWWDWARIARPYQGLTFRTGDEYQRWLLEYLRHDHTEARRGNVSSPVKAALDVMRDLRNEIRLVVDHGGLTGSSYRDELQGWYTALNAFVSIGPPASRIEEMIALIEAGVLQVLGPGMRVEPSPSGSGFLIDSALVPESAVEVTALIEARLPEVDIRRTTDPLLQYLLGTGQCSHYTIPDPPGTTTGTGNGGIAAGAAVLQYETGGLAVTRRPYHLVDAQRRPHARRFGFGVPTESVHWVTAAGIRPGVNSVILTDADAIARACLGLPAESERTLARKASMQATMQVTAEITAER